jgi:hypothetical protein
LTIRGRPFEVHGVFKDQDEVAAFVPTVQHHTRTGESHSAPIDDVT